MMMVRDACFGGFLVEDVPQVLWPQRLRINDCVALDVRKARLTIFLLVPRPVRIRFDHDDLQAWKGLVDLHHPLSEDGAIWCQNHRWKVAWLTLGINVACVL
jgi:hypothetical protein